MEKCQELRGEARLKLKNADHLITMTYQMVKDPKLLLAAIENLEQALELSITSVLTYERVKKRILPFHNDPESRFASFSQAVAPKYNIDKSYLKLIQNIRDIVKAHRLSPVEFSRDNKLIIASSKYELKELTPALVKNYLESSKQFIQNMEIIVSQDEHLHRRRN